jgi:hypothetical protein
MAWWPDWKDGQVPDHSRLARHGVVATLLMMGWLTVVLGIDHDGTLTTQRLMGALTWMALLLALTTATPLVRAQALVVVAFATAVEYVFSPGLEVYVYRFDNVPAYVPPGHGLVYLSAYALGHHPWVRRRLRALAWLAVVALGAWTMSTFVGPRSDLLGAFWFACLLAFLRWGASREVYVGAAYVVTWLEVAGTELGTWVWQTQDPVLGVSIGNPPSGAAGGYGWFDLVALLTAPWLLARWRAVASRRGTAEARPIEDVSEGEPRDAAAR